MRQIKLLTSLPLIMAIYASYLFSVMGDSPRPPIVPPIKVGEKTFYMETFFNATWYRAGQFCRLHGMHLASINNEAENDILGETIEIFGLHNYMFWTSGNDLDQAMSFVWQSTGNSLTYTYWRPVQPDNHVYPNETEHCLEIDNWVIFAGWNDRLCSMEMFFICEV